MAYSKSSKMVFFLLMSLFILQQVAFGCESCGSTPTIKPPHVPTPYVPPVTHTPTSNYCPVDALKLNACVDLLHGLLHLTLGKSPSTSTCCPLVTGLVDAEAAACLCTCAKADVLGINLSLNVKLTLLANTCGCNIPQGYTCA